MRTAPLAAVLLAASALLGACGYSTKPLVAERYRTIAVPVFDNETRRRDLEFEVTRAVVEEMQARTHLRVVPESDQPDLVLRGTLRAMDEDTLSREDFQRIREGVYFVTAEVSVKDAQGAVVVPSRRVHERESYVPQIGEDVRTARGEATRALAERIVRTLEQAW